MRACREAVWLNHSLFLGTRRDVDAILAAIAKIRAHARLIARSDPKA